MADDLVRRKLAACVNLVPVTSYYRWKGKVVNGREWLVIIKTHSRLFPKLKRRVLSLHSYELPELISLDIHSGYAPYLKWLDTQLSRD